MCEVIHHPHFDRPPVHQPHPRLRRGTINFRRRTADLRRAAAAGTQEKNEARERAERLTKRWADLREAEIIPLHIPNEGMEAYALVRTFMQLGLSVTFDTKRNAFVLYSREPFSPAS